MKQSPEEFASGLISIISRYSGRVTSEEILPSLKHWFPNGRPKRPERMGLRQGAEIVGRRLRLPTSESTLITPEILSAAFVHFFEEQMGSVSPFCPWIIQALGVHQVPSVSETAELRKVA